MPIDTYVRDFVTVWVVVDPIGTIPVFIAMTAGLSSSERRGVAIRAALFAAAILLVFILVGQILLEALGVSLISFQIAGSIVLFLFALQMIFGPAKPVKDIGVVEAEAGEGARETRVSRGDVNEIAVFPLAVPSLASPGAMLAVVVLTDNHRYSVSEQVVTSGLMLLVILAALVLMLAAGPINRLIGISGASILSRVMGLILATVAVDNFRLALISTGPYG